MRPADGIPVTLHPYQATVLHADGRGCPTERTRIAEAAARWTGAGWTAGWQVGFADEPLRPVELPHVWEEQPGRRHFSGSARYRTVVELAELDPTSTVVLDLGESRELSAAETEQRGPGRRLLPGRGSASPVGEIAAIR